MFAPAGNGSGQARAADRVRGGFRESYGCGILLLGLLACAGRAQAVLRFEVDATGLDPAEAEASQELLDAASARLPLLLRERLGVIALRWRDDLPERVHGRAHAGRVGLRRALLDDWMRRPADAGEADPATHAALSAVLHELAHVYDRGGAHLSSDPRLLDLAGWQQRPLRFGLRARRNDFRDRSPDPYELESPAEFVAVNLEYFLLDPEYACRRPALHRHFAAHFGWSPPHGACAPGLAYVSADADAGVAELLQLDPARVYAIDYLLAEGNDRPMSRWGHGMLRLVVCAPDRAPGPGCRLDLRHHRVLSFRAFVDDVQISSWRGLTGRYPSRLFVLPLDQVIDEYTKIELRGLQSIPLRLERGEIARLLERAARLHWSYDGRYYFVGNNCAVETWKLLHDGVPRLAALPLRSVTPTGLLRKLERAGVADASVLDDRAGAVRRGYRFESLAAYFQDMFEVADAALGLPVDDVQAWFGLEPARREPFLAQAGLRDGAALLLLEQAALRREELLARDELKRRYLRRNGSGDGEVGAAMADLRNLLQDGAYAGRPTLLLPEDAGYGLPQADERARLREALAASNARTQALRSDLLARARTLLPPAQRHRLEATEANLALLGRRLREWQADFPLSHRERGGGEGQSK